MIRRSLPAVLVLFLVAAGMLWSCSGSGITVGRYAFDLTLDDLPDSATMRGHYEGWAVGGDGVARSTGAFIIQGSDATAVVSSPNGARLYGTRALATFGPSSTQMGDNFPFIVNAHWFFITLEPEGDHDAVPSCQVLLAGAFVGNGLVLSTDAVAVNAGVDCGQVIGGTTYLGLGDVAAATGTCVMGSPTDADPVNDHAGVWFAGGLLPTAAAGLSLPQLGGSWTYEGWALVDGVWQSTGRFTDASVRDHDASTAPQRGSSGPGPELPGQDFAVSTTPAFPSDPPQLVLTSSASFIDGDYRCFVTVEPTQDNSAAPFSMPILEKIIPTTAAASGIGLLPVDLDPGTAGAMGANVQTAVGSLTLSALTLPDLGAGTSDRRGAYELFVTIAGVDYSVDRFVLDGPNVHSLTAGAVIGTATTVTFTPANTTNPSFPAVESADSVFITVENEADTDPMPSGSRILEAATLLSGGASMTFTAVDLPTVAGAFQLRTPSNNALGTPADDDAGVSFMSDSLQALLVLPIIGTGWVYEGWIEERSTGRLFSTGHFDDTSKPDSDCMIDLAGGSSFIPGFPGRDFVFDVPTVALAVATPTSITEVMITIEATPDAEFGPSQMIVLHGTIPSSAVVGGVAQQVVTLSNEVAVGNSLNYSGSLTINN